MMTKTLLHRGLPRAPLRSSVATLGNFDGVHRGHQELLRRTVEEKDDTQTQAIVLSFYPHPLKVLNPEVSIERLSSRRSQCELFSKFQIDAYYLLRFTEALSKLSARDFIEDVLIAQFGIKKLILGPDAKLGHKREGGLDFIAEVLSKHGAELIVVPELHHSGVKIGSREVRGHVLAGSCERATELLGRPYALESRVVHGDGRGGKELGFPTVNLGKCDQLHPGVGIYVTELEVDGERLPAVTSVGKRPTFYEDGEVVVETFILEYSGESLYGKRVKVLFHKFLRPEKKYDDVKELIEAIEHDVANAFAYFEERAQ